MSSFQRVSNCGHMIQKLHSRLRPKKGRLLTRFYTSRLLHFCLTLQDTAPIGSYCASQYGSFVSSGELTAPELTQARLHWIKTVQTGCFLAEIDAPQENVDLPRESKISRFNPFLAEGLIRLGGRLQRADLHEHVRHPLLLDGKHHFVRLLI